jgi:transcriptional regulator with XRE-family HTH domain
MEPAPPQNALSEFLRRYRQENYLTVQELAMRCGIPMATVIGLEYGDRPQEEDLEAIARGLEMPLSTIRRASLGEAIPMKESVADHDGDREVDLPGALMSGRPSTLSEAIQGLTPSQIEKTKDYIRFLRWSEQPDARD